MRRPSNHDTLPFDTLTLEGGLFVPELLERAARGEASQQTVANFGVPRGLKLQEEYGRAYRIAVAQWQAFVPQLLRTDLEAGVLTCGFAIDFLRDSLGYPDICFLSEPLRVDDSSGRAFPVSAVAFNGRIPVVIAPHTLDLDDPHPRFAMIGGGSRKKSPFQLTQEYLNATPDALWALCFNGHKLRLLRDADTLTRPAFLEFDLGTILREGEDRYADFAALWRILHGSRAGLATARPDDCIWESWKKEGNSQGLRIRDGLRKGVQEALLVLGNGFLAHRDNKILRDRLTDGSLRTDDYFQQLLRLVYRNLFLFCAEERKHPGTEISLLHDREADPDLMIRYSEGYGLRRLRSRATRLSALDRHGDLWQSLRVTFRSLTRGEPRLAIPALGGLFAVNQCPDLDRAALTNRDLLSAMRHLRWSNLSGRLTAIDYRNMGSEELGSVYESLLELIPTLDVLTRRFGFVGITDTDSAAGNARKTSGSYYTPDSLVKELIKSALDPLIDQKLAARPENPSAALLSISVVDPACGSGHFLIAAARRLAEKLAELRSPDGAVRAPDYRHALREVIAHCIYGVDRNPMALELARTALWLEGYEPGQPLSFLDHHLQCGDSLLGLTDFNQLRHGIPKEAFKPLTGDHADTCKQLAADNRAGLKAFEARFNDPSIQLYDAADFDNVLRGFEVIEAMPDSSTEEVEAKKEAYIRFLTEAQESTLAHACDLLIAAYLTPKTPETVLNCPTTITLRDLLFPQNGEFVVQAVIDEATHRCRDAQVFHWPIRFARIFGNGGFDCVLGNPPWDMLQLDPQEYFANRAPHVAIAKNMAARDKEIARLKETDLWLFRQYWSAKRTTEAQQAFVHSADRFEFSGRGRINLASLFTETCLRIICKSGRAGLVSPSGIATDSFTQHLWNRISDGSLISLLDFENREGIFSGVHRSYKFCLLTIGD